jgi:DNA-binding response OmpR family regulator
MADALTRAGFEVVAVADGEAALQHLRSGANVGLVVLDLMMPGLTGWDLRAAQLADPKLAAIPTIVLTVAHLQQYDDHVLRAADYLHKPLDPEEFVAIVAAHLRPG